MLPKVKPPYPLSQHISLARAFAMSTAYDLWSSHTARWRAERDRAGDRGGWKDSEMRGGRGGRMAQCLIFNTQPVAWRLN